MLCACFVVCTDVAETVAVADDIHTSSRMIDSLLNGKHVRHHFLTPANPCTEVDGYVYRVQSVTSDILLLIGWWCLFPRLRGFGENVRPFIPRRAFFLLLCFFFFWVEISSRTLVPLFMTGSVHCGSASWDDCGRMFPDKLRVSSFPDRFPHYACTTV